MLAQHLTVVARENDQAALRHAEPIELIQNQPDLVIDSGDHSHIIAARLPNAFFAERLFVQTMKDPEPFVSRTQPPDIAMILRHGNRGVLAV